MFVVPKPSGFVESRDIESELSQYGGIHRKSPHKDLENHAQTRRNDPARTMLAEVADPAMMQVDAETEPDDPAVAVDNVTETDGVPVGHISKNIAFEAGGDGMRAGCPNMIDDHENIAIEDRAKTSAVDDPMGRAESRQQSCSEAQGSRTVHHQNNDLLQQTTILCATVQSLGKQMQDGSAAERIRRQEDYKNMVETMSGKMEEGFRSEQQARQQAQNEIMEGLKNEENARQLVQQDLAVMKEENKNLEMGSGSTVCSEASTGVGLGALGTLPREVFKDY